MVSLLRNMGCADWDGHGRSPESGVWGFLYNRR